MTARSTGEKSVSETSHSAIYPASAEGETGKSTIALGLLAQLSATGGRIGVFRPISRTPDGKDDYILELLLAHDSVGLDYADCIGVTYDVSKDPEGALSVIVDRFHAVQERCDTVLVVGSDYPTSATRRNCPTTRASRPTWRARWCWRCASDRTPEEVRGLAVHALAEVSAAYATAVAVVVNRVDPARLEATRTALEGLGPSSGCCRRTRCSVRRRWPSWRRR